MWGCRLVMLAGVLTVLSPEVGAAEPANETCTRLKESIPAADIGLPTGDATIESAELKQPTPLTLAELPFKPLPSFLAVVPAAPEYCKVVGAIAPVDPKSPADPLRGELSHAMERIVRAIRGRRVQWHAHHRSWPAAVDAV